jgi:hypothetical protein
MQSTEGHCGHWQIESSAKGNPPLARRHSHA